MPTFVNGQVNAPSTILKALRFVLFALESPFGNTLFIAIPPPATLYKKPSKTYLLFLISFLDYNTTKRQCQRFLTFLLFFTHFSKVVYRLSVTFYSLTYNSFLGVQTDVTYLSKVFTLSNVCDMYFNGGYADGF